MELTRLINHENAIVVDLRKQDEFNNGHILNSKNVPVDQFSDREKELETYKTRTVILCCNMGNDSPRIARILNQKGFENVYCLKGGIQSWRSASLPLNRDNES